MTIEIKNRLQVLQDKVLVPGHEPLSEQTTSALSAAMQGVSCYIHVDLALKLIPGSRILINNLDTGTFGHNKQFELPDGPPPNGSECPSNCIKDWYEILREAARINQHGSGECQDDCSSYDTGPQCSEYDDFYNNLDKEARK